MSMTKKHFILAATEFGRILKSYNEEHFNYFCIIIYNMPFMWHKQ